jgi:hypothetical protein
VISADGGVINVNIAIRGTTDEKFRFVDFKLGGGNAVQKLNDAGHGLVSSAGYELLDAVSKPHLTSNGGVAAIL